jgi:hypothetical protein
LRPPIIRAAASRIICIPEPVHTVV